MGFELPPRTWNQLRNRAHLGLFRFTRIWSSTISSHLSPHLLSVSVSDPISVSIPRPLSCLFPLSVLWQQLLCLQSVSCNFLNNGGRVSDAEPEPISNPHMSEMDAALAFLLYLMKTESKRPLFPSSPPPAWSGPSGH